MSAKPKDTETKQGTIGEAIADAPTTSNGPAPAEAGATQEPPAAPTSGGVPARRAAVPIQQRGIQIENLDALARIAMMISKSGLAPKGMESPEAIAVAIEMGLEIGLAPMTALQNIAVINGRPGIFGDAAKAVCEASGLMEDFDEWFEVDGKRADGLPASPKDTDRAMCMSKRVGRNPLVTPFSVGDAKRAKLWMKTGNSGQDTPWITYPGRMLKFRARGFNLRDNFPDQLKGIRTVEELQDFSDLEAVDTEIVMPKRLSETTAAAAPAEQAAPASTSTEIDGKPVHLIAAVTKSASGTEDGGKPFNVWSVKTRSGLVCETRSDGIAAQAKKHQANDSPVRLELTEPTDGLPQISSLTAL
jgi:hypothetical protein